MPGHPLFNFLAAAFAMHRAAANSREHQLLIRFVMQINCGFETAKRLRNFIHDLVDQFVEIKDGADLLRCLLQLNQVLDLLNMQIANRGVIGAHYRGTGSHGNLVTDWMTIG